MSVVFSQVFILFAFMLAGFLLIRLHAVSEDDSGALSRVLANVFLPAMMFNTMATGLSMETVAAKLPFLFAGAINLCISLIFGSILSKLFSKDPYERVVYLYNFTVPNFGFIGYALMSAVYGSENLLNFMIFALPSNVYVQVEGIRMLSGQSKRSLKGLLNPSLLATALGIIVGLTGIKLPEVILDITASGSACMSPTALLMTGMILGTLNIKETVTDVKLYIFTFLRLIGIPGVVLTLLKLFNVNYEIMLSCAMFLTMPAGMMPLVYGRMSGQNCRVAASLAFLTSIACMGTIPLMLSLFV